MNANEHEEGPRKHQSVDVTGDVLEPGQGTVAYLSGSFPSTLGLLEDETSTRASGYHESCCSMAGSF